MRIKELPLLIELWGRSLAWIEPINNRQHWASISPFSFWFLILFLYFHLLEVHQMMMKFKEYYPTLGLKHIDASILKCLLSLSFCFLFLSFFLFLKKKSFLLGIEWWSDDEIRNEILGHLPTPSEFHLAVDEKNHFYSDDDDDETACKSSPVFQFFFLVF